MQKGKPRALQAGNIYARRPVLVMELEDAARTRLLPEVVELLLVSLPPMRDEVLDFPAMRRIMRAEEGIPASAAVELLAVLAQRYMNWPVRFCAWRPQGRRNDASRAIFEFGTRRTGIIAGRLAAETMAAFVSGVRGAALEQIFRDKLHELARKTVRVTPSLDGMDMARVAAARGIPWTTLPGSIYLRLGWGRHAVVLRGSETTRTSSIGAKLAHRKSVSSAVLRSAGLPVPAQRRVRRLEDALAAAREIGFPLVVKPAFGKMGKGVSVGLTEEAAIPAAFERAQTVSNNVLVEAMIPGEEYRLLAIGGRFVAAARRRPARVLGNGVSTVRQLIEQENARPEREAILPGQMASRLPIILDEEALELLAEQDIDPESVPAAGEVVLLRRVSNVSRGGDAVDETDRIHPSIRMVAERVSAILGLDICGVDFLTSDISRPWWETGGGICEVNSRPGLTVHSRVSEGRRRDVAVDVVDMLYPKGAAFRFPVVVVLEGEETAPLVDAVVAAAARAGRRLGVVASANRRRNLGGTTAVFEDAASLPWDESIDAALVEASARDIVRSGLGIDQADLAILPPKSSSGTVSRAGAALSRIAGKRVISAGDPAALERALEVLGLRSDSDARTRPATVATATATRATKASAPVPGQMKDRFRVLMVGDIGFGEAYMHHPRAGQLHHLLGTYGHRRCLENLEGLIGAADHVIGNLGVPLARHPDPGLRGRKKHLLWSEGEQVVEALGAAGVHALSLANRHSLDCGTAGLIESIGHLQASGIAPFGAGSDRDAAEDPLVVHFTVGGIERSLVVFAGFEYRERYARRYRWYAGPGISGVAELSPERIAERVSDLRASLPSPVFVAFPHWGRDYAGVTEEQRELAARLVDAGMDLVVGHGARILQPPEIMDGTPVFHGIGNFVWNAPGRFARFGAKPFGMALSIEFTHSGDVLRLYPLMTDNAITGFQNRTVTEAEFDEAAAILSGDLPQEPHRGQDEFGHYLELSSGLLAAPGEGWSGLGTPVGSVSAHSAAGPEILEGVD